MPKKQKSAKPKRRAPDSPLPSDLEDEVDKFHRKREKLSLNAEDDLSDDGDSLDEDEAILDVSEGSDELDTDDEIERKTHLGKRELCWEFCASASFPAAASTTSFTYLFISLFHVN